jgi:Thermolysin metallopeptidase, catalytic domain
MSLKIRMVKDGLENSLSQLGKLMNMKNIQFRIIAISAIMGASLPAVAGSAFSSLPEMLDKEWQSHSVLRSTRLIGESLAGGNRLNLDGHTPHDAVRIFLRDQGLHPLLNLVPLPSDRESSSLGLVNRSPLSVHEYSLQAGHFEVCKSSIKMIETSSGAAFVLGVAPNVDGVYPMTADAWSSKEAAVGLAADALQQSGVDVRSVRVTSLSKCVFPIQGELRPAWKIILRAATAPYLLYVGVDGVIEGDVLAFDTTGTVRAYDSNPSTGKLTDFTITLSGDGYLTNDYFTTADAGTTAVGREKSTSNQFTNAPSTSFFPEQSSFAHVNRHRDFAEANGYTWVGPKPLTVKNHVVFSGGKVNNAQYTPYDGTSGPFIQIGDGDGTTLQNLPLDSDVVSHEFGHHVIFSSITTTTGESLILHEGLADTITFMQSGDSCLGESICPAASTLCQVAAKCLRTGSNTLKYNDAAYTKLKSAAHLAGQLVSGFFWDLRKGGSIPVADLNKLVIGTIPFLPKDADIKALIIAVLDADFSLFTSKYQSIILAAASARGMGIDTLGISLSGIDGKSDTSTAAAASSSTKSKSFLGLCSIGSVETTTASSLWIAMGLLLPVAVQLIRRPKVAHAKIPKR